MKWLRMRIWVAVVWCSCDLLPVDETLFLANEYVFLQPSTGFSSPVVGLRCSCDWKVCNHARTHACIARTLGKHSQYTADSNTANMLSSSGRALDTARAYS